MPHKALVPHKAFVPQSAFVPHRALVPQSAFEPHRALLPQRALEPVMVVDEVPAINCADPHTAAFDQLADVFHTALRSSLRYTLPVFAS